MSVALGEAIAAWPDRLIGLPEWETLPEDESHQIECSEGNLIVVPKPYPVHQRVARRLTMQLEAQLPPVLTAEADCEVLLSGSPLTVRAPDLVVVSAEAFAANPPRFTPDQVAVAVEVLSEGSRRMDRVTKYSEYADAGIERYWIVDPVVPATLDAFVLGHDDRYRCVVEHAIGIVELGVGNMAVRIDLTGLASG
jgi:Uma2 family endonuclease